MSSRRVPGGRRLRPVLHRDARTGCRDRHHQWHARHAGCDESGLGQAFPHAASLGAARQPARTEQAEGSPLPPRCALARRFCRSFINCRICGQRFPFSYEQPEDRDNQTRSWLQRQCCNSGSPRERRRTSRRVRTWRLEKRTPRLWIVHGATGGRQRRLDSRRRLCCPPLLLRVTDLYHPQPPVVRRRVALRCRIQRGFRPRETTAIGRTAQIILMRRFPAKSDRGCRLVLIGAAGCIFIGASLTVLAASTTPSKEDFRRDAMLREGDAQRGKELFQAEQKTACSRCHSVDGTASKAGPDLFAVGDKFPRRDLINAVIDPSSVIAVGYGATIVETKSGEEYQGILKDVTAEAIELIGADSQRVRIASRDVRAQRGSDVSLMPEGLQAGLSLQEFTDLIEYLVTLKQPESAHGLDRGMPAMIPELTKPAAVRPFFSEAMEFPHSVVQKPGDVRTGVTWFGQLPGIKGAYLVVHQTGKIWLLEKKATTDTKTLFVDLTSEIFYQRGPNGLLSIAFHPRFRQNRKYYLNHQILEDGKIVCAVVEREVAADLRADSGKASRLVWKATTTTQDHTGGGIQFGPDGFLYIGL